MITVVGNKPYVTSADKNIGVVGDNNVKTLEFSIAKMQGDTDLSIYTAWACIERSLPNGGTSYPAMVTTRTEGDQIIVSLPISGNETKNYGYIYASIKFANVGFITKFEDGTGGKVRATSAEHGLGSSGAVVEGVTIGATTNYNGTYDVTVVDSNRFTFVDTFVSNQTGWFSSGEIWQTERCMLKISKGINGETEVEPLETNIFDQQVAVINSYVDALQDLAAFDWDYITGAKKPDIVNEHIYMGVNSGNDDFYGVVDDNIGIGTNALENISTGAHNVAVGMHAMDSNTTGINNTAIGSGALQVNTMGCNNVAIGADSAGSNTIGSENVAVGVSALFNASGSRNVGIGYGSLDKTQAPNMVGVGYKSLYSNTTGVGNVGLGAYSLYSNIIGNYNVGIGQQALQLNENGEYNCAFGYNALKNNTTHGNSAFGYQALGANTTGFRNCAFGTSTLAVNTAGSYNSAFGYGALLSCSNGTYNTAVGYAALDAGGSQNTAVGANCAPKLIGSDNCAFGMLAMYKSTNADNNCAFGNQAMYYNTTGMNNCAIGIFSLNKNTTGEGNVAMGTQAMYTNTDGNRNVAIGMNSLYHLTGGGNDYNVGIGLGSGMYYTLNTNNLTASNGSIFIGHDTRSKNNNSSNEIVIGQSTVGNGNNTVTIGNTSITDTILRGNVKIGTKLTALNGTDPAVGITPASADNSTNIATTAFVKNVAAPLIPVVQYAGTIEVNKVYTLLTSADSVSFTLPTPSDTSFVNTFELQVKCLKNFGNTEITMTGAPWGLFEEYHPLTIEAYGEGSPPVVIEGKWNNLKAAWYVTIIGSQSFTPSTFLF